jgi:HEAT repeat protein
MACFAVERIPGPAAEDALRRALKSVDGKLRLGLIHALGNRRSESAAADLILLLNSEDRDSRQAAAAALGKIGGPAAAKALTAALTKAPVAERAHLADSCLKCAEQFQAAGNHAEALALYQRLRAPDVPKTARMAATRGILRSKQPSPASPSEEPPIRE